MKLFKGSGVAIITPFIGDQINESLFISLIEWHIQNKTDALIVGGTTGESATLSYQEKLRLYQLAVATAKKRIPVIANTGTHNTKESIALSMAAENSGVDGLLLVTPYYNKPTQKGLIAHFKAIAQSVNLPIILYNVPGRTSVNLMASTTIMLSKVDNIMAIKEASGDLDQIQTIIKAVDKDFYIYSGSDHQIYDILKLGGQGVISVVANLAPYETHLLCEIFDKDQDKAHEIQDHLNVLDRVLYIESNPVPVKTALMMLGVSVGIPRLPLVVMDEENQIILKNAMTVFGLKDIHL
jgi:4-hydroxy-tetrahydrodipicolinate synthase